MESSAKSKLVKPKGSVNPYEFPYEPYQVQLDLMDKIHTLLQSQQKLGLFESPTGTGKSLSLVCSTLTWYLNKSPYPENTIKKPQVKPKTDDDWLSMFGQVEETQDNAKLQTHKLHKKRVYSELNSNDIKSIHANLQRKKEERRLTTAQTTDTNLLTYDSENERKQKKLKKISQKAKSLMVPGNQQVVHQKEKQIIICSRTHSQISQLLNEIKKTSFSQQISAVPITSRKGLCVHEKLKDIQNVTTLNEKCQDLNEKSKCPYNDNQLNEILGDNLLDQIHDIEELGVVAKRMKICGYFSSRRALAEADVIVTPYQSILSESTRESLDIDITNKILIFDEAHNIMDTICSLNSVSITQGQMNHGRTQINEYLKKYGNRLAPKNLKSMKDIINILNSFIQYFNNKHTEQIKQFTIQDTQQRLDDAQNKIVVDVMDILTELDIYRVDFYQLSQFFDKSDLTRKLNGFIQSQILANSQQKQNQDKSSIGFYQNKSVLYAIKEFMRILSLNPADGKFIVSVNTDKQDQSEIQYLCLNPTTTLKRIADQVKCLIFISGTLEPTQEFRMLIKSIGQEQTMNFSCGHIIPKQNFQAYIIPEFNNVTFDFRYENRHHNNLKKILADLIIDTCTNKSIRGGIIVFLQSYSYKEEFSKYFRQAGYFEKVPFKVFEELRDQDIFPLYTKEITQHKKQAILFCVIGGKLSEGINFSDDLARTLIVCGLPYANARSVEIVEKMKYFNSLKDDQFKGADFYENICIKTLNQAIGRAIRHINDWACIMLLDQRFSKNTIHSKLPKWIQDSVTIVKKDQNIQGLQSEFFLNFQQ